MLQAGRLRSMLPAARYQLSTIHCQLKHQLQALVITTRAFS